VTKPPVRFSLNATRQFFTASRRESFKLRGIRRNGNQMLLGRHKCDCICISYTFHPVWKTFGTGDAHKNLFSVSECREDRHSVNDTLLKGLNKFLPALSALFGRFWPHLP
jgi:hypothetical protein